MAVAYFAVQESSLPQTATTKKMLFNEDDAVVPRSRVGSAPHRSLEGFMDHFQDVGGIEVIESLIARNRYGRKFTESLIQYMHKRVELEKEYAKGLEKLAEFEFPSLEKIMKKALGGYGGFDKSAPDMAKLQQILEGIQQETKILASSHKNYAKSVDVEVLKGFKKSFNDQLGTKMKHKARLFDAAKKLSKAEEKLVAQRKSIISLEQKLTEAESKQRCNPENEAHKNAASLAKNAVEAAHQKIKDDERAIASKRKDIQEGIRQAAVDIHSAEINRMTLAKDKIAQFCFLMKEHADAFVLCQKSIKLSLQDFNPEVELVFFARKYITGAMEHAKSAPGEAAAQERTRTASVNVPLCTRIPPIYQDSDDDDDQGEWDATGEDDDQVVTEYHDDHFSYE